MSHLENNPLTEPEVLQAVAWLKRVLQTGLVKGFHTAKLEGRHYAGGAAESDTIILPRLRDWFVTQTGSGGEGGYDELPPPPTMDGTYKNVSGSYNRDVIGKVLTIYSGAEERWRQLSEIEGAARGNREAVRDQEREVIKSQEEHELDMATEAARLDFQRRSARLVLRAAKASVQLTRIAKNSPVAGRLLEQAAPLKRPLQLTTSEDADAS